MKKCAYFFLGFLLLAVASACHIEEAQPSKYQEVIIASDCLESKDTILFASFSKEKKIRIKILRMSADSLQKRLNIEGLKTNIDAAILFSAYDMYSLEKKQQLQKIPNESHPKNLLSKFKAKSGKWIGIGMDPYVFVSVDDTNRNLRTYSDLLKKNKWCTNISGNSELYPFFAPIVQKMDPLKKYNASDWITNFNQKINKEYPTKDSVKTCNALLSRYSVFYTIEKNRKINFQKGKIIYPNQRTGGSFYNMICFGIIRQSKNYKNALEFYDHLLLESVIKRLNNKLKTFPVISTGESAFAYQNIRFKKYGFSPLQLTSNYKRIENILKLKD